jgi:enoyl-CoA hydratase/carnithine racemase
MTEHRIDVVDDSGVRLIAFDRPDVRNAFDAAMYHAVTEALVDAQEDEGIRTVVLAGRGKAFTSGQDLREMAAIATGTDGEQVGSGFQGLLEILTSFDKPLLAAVHGVGMGLGCTILGHVDVAIIEEDARLRAPFAELGVPPEAASSWLFPERMGWQQAALVLLGSEWIDAQRAVASGLAVRVCPTGQALDETLALARRMATFPSHATRQIKRLMMAAHRDAISEARQREEGAFAALFADPEHNPGSQLSAGLGH